MSVADHSNREITAAPRPAGARQGARAGVVSRTAAMVVDAAVSAAIVAAGYGLWAGVRLLRAPRRFAWPELPFPALASLALIVAVVLLTVTWTSTGRSPGAHLMGLRVLGTDGSPPHLGRSFLRAIACVAVPVGLFWSAVSRRNASIQDLLFSTSVVYDWHERP